MGSEDTKCNYSPVSSRTRSKRKHCDDPARQSAACTRRRLQPRQTAWDDLLPADLVGTLATFLDPKSILEYAVTAGPKQCQTIKRACLKRNFRFLNEHGKPPHVFRAFLEVNHDWKYWYDNPSCLSPIDRNYFDVVFGDIRVAIANGQVDIVRHLVEVRGVDINQTVSWSDDSAPTKFIAPLLFGAIIALKLPMVEYLLSNEGFNVNATSVRNDGMEFNCLHLAGTLEFKNQSEQVALVDIVALLLSRSDINVNAENETGLTALHIAAAEPNTDKFLLRPLLTREDININAAATQSRQSPLHIAVRFWCDREVTENIKCLIEAGADPHFSDIDNKTPLDYATPEQAAMMKEWLRKSNPPLRSA